MTDILNKPPDKREMTVLDYFDNVAPSESASGLFGSLAKDTRDAVLRYWLAYEIDQLRQRIQDLEEETMPTQTEVTYEAKIRQSSHSPMDALIVFDKAMLRTDGINVGDRVRVTLEKIEEEEDEE